MKRTGFAPRKKPLEARKGLSRGKGLQRSPIKARPGALAGCAKPEAKRNLPKRKPSKEKAQLWELCHLAAVKSLPCRVCGKSGPNDAHHCFHDRATKFDGKKAPHRCTIPLCKHDHQDGPEAIHKTKRSWRAKHGADYDHLPAVMASIYGKAEMTDQEIKEYWEAKGMPR